MRSSFGYFHLINRSISTDNELIFIRHGNNNNGISVRVLTKGRTFRNRYRKGWLDAAPASRRGKKFHRNGTHYRYSSVQPIGVGITRRCADFFADSNCLFEFSPLFPGPRNGQERRGFFLKLI